MLTLAAPWILLVLPLPWLVWRFAPAYHEQSHALRIPFFHRVTQAAGITPQKGSVVLHRSRLQITIAVAIWALLILALSRPEHLGDPIVVETSARDIVLALDVSGSMEERDFKAPDGSPQPRLDAVKQVLSQFIEHRDSDRLALIVFGTRAFIQAPFTQDLQALTGFLEQTQPGMAGPNTALGDAIGLAIRAFDASQVDDRLLILLSDGADTASHMTPINAASIAKDRGVVITTIGVGDPKGSGENRVDLDLLQRIAGTTGGDFFFADNGEALNSIYTQIDAQTPRLVEQKSYRPRQNLSHIPLMISLVLLMFSITALHLKNRKPSHQNE